MDNNLPNQQAANKPGPAVSRKTLLLILVLGLIAFVLLYIAVKPQKTPTPPVVPTPTPFAFTTLSLQLANPTPNVLPSSVNVVANTGANKIVGVQFTLKYDPKELTNVDIKPGSFIPNANILQKNIDPTTGTISYIEAITPGEKQPQGTGTVAVLSFTIATPSSVPTTVAFTGKTLVGTLGLGQSVLKSTHDITFIPNITKPY